METDSINPEIILYNYIEFFFSKNDLKQMMTVKPLSYEPWLEQLYTMYSSKPTDDSFHYNIMHTETYENIMKLLKDIETITKIDKNIKTDDIKKIEITQKFIDIQREYINLYYYDEIYMYAHYVFNNIRSSGVLQMGGGITLEDFKKKIRDKIKLLGL
jgi:hypothetical protein